MTFEFSFELSINKFSIPVGDHPQPFVFIHLHVTIPGIGGLSYCRGDPQKCLIMKITAAEDCKINLFDVSLSPCLLFSLKALVDSPIQAISRNVLRSLRFRL